jgi:hypothetical protein
MKKHSIIMSSTVASSLSASSARVARAVQSGRVYRREDLAPFSAAIDRHLQELVSAGRLTKLARGLYYAPRQSAFGVVPPADEDLAAAFLKDRDFLLFSPSAYNAAGLGTTQLYNATWVYNRKRHGVFTLGNRQYDFRVKPRFPKRLSDEFLFVDALNNLSELAEDEEAVLARARQRVPEMDGPKLKRALEQFASAATRKLVTGWLAT